MKEYNAELTIHVRDETISYDQNKMDYTDYRNYYLSFNINYNLDCLYIKENTPKEKIEQMIVDNICNSFCLNQQDCNVIMDDNKYKEYMNQLRKR